MKRKSTKFPGRRPDSLSRDRNHDELVPSKSAESETVGDCFPRSEKSEWSSPLRLEQPPSRLEGTPRARPGSKETGRETSTTDHYVSE